MEKDNRLHNLKIGDRFYFGKTKRVIYEVVKHIDEGTHYHLVEYRRINNGKYKYTTDINAYVTKIETT